MGANIEWTLIRISLIFIGLQITTPVHTNPVFDEAQTLEAMTPIPSGISAVFARSCNDCHSNKTNWRWYTYVAPVSWFTVGHVNDGRAELNFSVWGSYGTRMKETRLKALCYQCKSGTMPLASYAFAHRDARLSPDEVKMICDWTEREIKHPVESHSTQTQLTTVKFRPRA
jgi:hypothetical protein